MLLSISYIPVSQTNFQLILEPATISLNLWKNKLKHNGSENRLFYVNHTFDALFQ